MIHTPTPWVAAKSASGKTWYVGHRGSSTSFTMQMPPGFSPEFLEADVEFIVRAVNAYDDFLEALTMVAEEDCCQSPGCSFENPWCSTMTARAAIAKAKGEAS